MTMRSMTEARSALGRRYVPAIALTVSLFFLWGMANNLNDILIAQFRKAFVLSDFGTSFVQQVFYLGYFLFAVPASLLMRTRGYKAAIVTGLLLYGAGALLFYPAAVWGEYLLFLAALFVIASGLAFLETSANPLMTELGDPAGAARRINWAQAANPLGAISGILIGRQFILSGIEHDEAALAGMGAAEKLAWYRMEIQAVQAPYLVIGLGVLAFAVAAMLIRFPGSARQDAVAESTERPRYRDAFRHPRLIAAVLAQFFYVGAQVGIWSYTIRYAGATAGIGEKGGADMLFVSLALFAAGRFVGSMLLGRVAASRMLALFALISLVLMVVAIGGGRTGLAALVATSFFMSIQFPTIFALGLDGLGRLRHAGASLIVMAIIGGAALTAVMGLVSDAGGIAAAMIVPALSFVVIASFAMLAPKLGAKA